MFCNNCGAQITPEQKFCNNCGVALNPQISYRPQGQQPPMGQLPPKGQPPVQPVQVSPQGQRPIPPMPPVQPGQGQPPMQPPMQPGPMPPMNQPPKKKTVWPIILIIVLILLLVSVLSVWGVNKLYKSLYKKYFGSIDSPIHANIDTDFDFDFGTDALDEQEEILDELEDQKEDMLDEFGIDDDFDLDEYSLDGENYTYKDCDYASIVQMEDFTYIETLKTMNDSTELRPGKTMGALCDYIDSEVLEKGRKIDRDLLYDLVSVHVIDDDFVKEDEDLERNLMYCLSLANEFSGQGIRVSDCMYDSSTGQDQYYYDVSVNGEYDTWVVNLGEGKLYMDYGDTEYTSAGQYGMFTTDTYAVWATVIDLFYEID